jgi:two-component system NtrC family sensor kinase
MTQLPQTANLRGDAILIVDDDESIRNLMSRIVKMLNGTPVVAASIAEAEQAVGARAFACALIDKNLGKDQNGLDFLRWIRLKQPDCAPVMVTAFGNIESAVEALRLGAADYLLKPFALDVISHRLDLLCERRRMIHERDLLQTQLMQTDRLAALGTLAAGVVHEINNPLTYLVSNLDYLRERLDAMAKLSGALDAELKDLRDVVVETQEGATQMAAVVNHIKTFARHEDAKRGRVHLRSLLEGALKMSTVLIRHRAQLKRDFGQAPDVEALDFQLAQVFINLLVNAAQSITEGAAHENEVGVRLFTGAGGEAVVEISDTGAGMSPEILGRLFEPFFTTKPPGMGTGVGLTICRNIVEGHGGRIEVESTVGKGSLFRVILPAMAAAIALVPVAAAAPTPVTLRGRVLIIDDDPSLVSSLRRCLENDHDVATELSGRRALERIAAGERFDAIISDLSMPDVTGNQLYRTLEAEHPGQASKVIFMTAGVLSLETSEFAGKMVDRLFEKPLVLSQLRETIRRLISAP